MWRACKPQRSLGSLPKSHPGTSSRARVCSPISPTSTEPSAHRAHAGTHMDVPGRGWQPLKVPRERVEITQLIVLQHDVLPVQAGGRLSALTHSLPLRCRLRQRAIRQARRGRASWSLLGAALQGLSVGRW